MGERKIQRRVRSGNWQRAHPAVYIVGAAPPSWHQRLIAACHWGGKRTVVSHRAAAALWQLPRGESRIVEITTPKCLRSRDITVHRRSLSDRERRRLGGIPVTDIERTLIDVASVSTRAEIETALDDALRRRLTSIPRLQERLRECAEKRQRGLRKLERIVASRDPALAPPESVLETKLLLLLSRARLPSPVPQHEIRNGGRVIARVDFAYVPHQLAVEVDGYRYHSDRLTWQRDLKRQNQLGTLGWRVLRFSWEDVVRRPSYVQQQVRRMLAKSQAI